MLTAQGHKAGAVVSLIYNVCMTVDQQPRTPFTLGTYLSEPASGEPITRRRTGEPLGRTGTIHTPHGDIHTPAFIPVGTRATVKTLTPEQIRSTGAQAVLGNAYHLYLQPGPDIVDEAGGIASFMNWDGPTYTDSGGFQVLSLGSGFKKVLAAEFAGTDRDGEVRKGKERMANVDDDGVTFRSHLDGSLHRFTPEVSMQIQHHLGADIIFAFDELTTLLNSRGYQEEALERTRLWAERCLVEHSRLTAERTHRPPQALWGVIQGAQYEELRRKACRDLQQLSVESEERGGVGFGGFGIGGALQKENLGTIVGWCNQELPEDKPRHLLGISEPDDIFTAVENGADTFDCVAPSRLGRHGGVYTRDGRMNLVAAKFKRDFRPIDPELASYTSQNYSRAYLRHLLKSGEKLGQTLCTIHNLFFIVQLVDGIREAMENGTYWEYKAEVLGRYYGGAR